MNKTLIATWTAAAALSGVAFAGTSPTLQQAEQQARAEGKLLVVALCPGTTNACASYLQTARQAASMVMLRNWAVFATPDVTADPYAFEMLKKHGSREYPEMDVFGPDGKLLWSVGGPGSAGEIAASMDKGVCTAAVHNAPQIPAAFTAQNRPVCEGKAKGVSWSAEPEVIRPAR